eukprot:gene20448-21075_t
MELGDIKSAISFRLGNSTPSLKMEVENPDEKTRVEMEKILVVAPPDFWVDTHIIRGIRNPSLVFWMNKTLILWPVINYGANTCFIQFCWLNENFTIDARAENFGIDANTRIKTLSFNRIDEDPRLLLLKNGESYLVIHFNASSQRAEFQDSALLHSPSINAIGKNWIPFEYNQSIYLIVSINPSHIVELLPGRDRNETEKGLLRNVVYNESEKNLPWLGKEFGRPLRGGSAAVLVRGVYLTFFHTLRTTTHHKLGKRSTYFMGVMMSRYPIVDPKWDLYQGPWCYKALNYVVYPVGLALEPDGKHLWLSLGHQDAQGDG